MIVGVNCLYMIPGGVGGTEIYLQNLLGELSRVDPGTRYLLFANRETPRDWFPPANNLEVIPCPVDANSRPKRLLFEQFLLPRYTRRHGVQVLLNPGFTAPAFCPCPMVTVIHDLQHKRHPEFFRRFDLPFWELFVFLAIRRSRRLIAVSESTAQDIQRFYGASAAGKVSVIHHGVDPAFLEIANERKIRGKNEPPFILCVSTLHPHKNLSRLLQAFQLFARTHAEYRLVIAGLKGFATEALESGRTRLHLEDSVHFTGWIPRQQLLDLYRTASAFIYPSQFEGFGMPVFEAMAAGLPVACSAIEPLLSLAGESATFFDPFDVNAIAAALEHLVNSEFQPAGNTRQYTWAQAAQSTFDVMRQAISIPTARR